MALVHAVRAGPVAATTANKTDARIWKEVAELQGGTFKTLETLLTWMPAHTTAAAASTRAKSNGKMVTPSEWRANQLADVLAKKGALKSELRDKADLAIKAASEALLHAAARLGTVTGCQRASR